MFDRGNEASPKERVDEEYVYEPSQTGFVARLFYWFPFPVRVLIVIILIWLSITGIIQTWNTVIPHYVHCDMCFETVDSWYTIRMTDGWNPVSYIMNHTDRPEKGNHAAYTLCENCFKVWESSFRYYRLHDAERKAVLEQ